MPRLQVMAQIAEHRMNPLGGGQIAIEIVAQDGGGVTINASASGVLDYAVDVQIVRFLDEATVEIMAGENAGREITYRNIVTDWIVLGLRGTGLRHSATHCRDAVPDGTGLAVLVQEQGLGPIPLGPRAIRDTGLW